LQLKKSPSFSPHSVEGSNIINITLPQTQQNRKKLALSVSGGASGMKKFI